MTFFYDFIILIMLPLFALVILISEQTETQYQEYLDKLNRKKKYRFLNANDRNSIQLVESFFNSLLFIKPKCGVLLSILFLVLSWGAYKYDPLLGRIVLGLFSMTLSLTIVSIKARAIEHRYREFLEDAKKIVQN
jgi:hypothetical protein